MTPSIAEPMLRPHPPARQSEPGGLWRNLARAVDAPAVGVGDVWRGLERRTGNAPAADAAHAADERMLAELVLGPPDTTQYGLYEALVLRVDPAQYRPCALPDVAEEQVREAGETFTVLRSPRGLYLRLTPPQRELWHAMDGTRTVAQLATHAFQRYGQLLPVGELVAALRQAGFLADAPVGVYRSLARTIGERTPEGWGRRVLRVLAGHQLPIHGLDGFYAALYRAGGWLLFTRAFAVLAAIVIVAGLVSFVRILLDTSLTTTVISLNGSVAQGLVALWCAVFVSLVLHESAHALAVRHYGRTVLGGGLMLYYGLPAAYVDTSDIWRSRRRARVVVSAAGPAADLLVGSVAALAATWLLAAPPSDVLALSLGGLAFKLAFTSYAGALFNLNPLLELDGYFILVDVLRMPDLRRRSLAFVRGPLWEKAKGKRQKAKQEHRGVLPFAFSIMPWASREERIYTLFGLAAGLYTLFAIVAAGWLWFDQIVRPAYALLDRSDAERQLGLLVLGLVVAPASVAILLGCVELGRAALTWLLRRGYGRRPALLATLSAVAAVALTVGVTGPWWAGVPGGALVWPIAAALLWLGALAALLAIQPDYRGAAVAPALMALVGTTVLAAVAGVLRALSLSVPVWTAVEGLAFVFLLLAGFAALLDVDLRFATLPELALTALLLIVAFVVGGIALFAARGVFGEASPLLALAAAAPAYFGALALAMLLPHLFGLQDSRLFWSWGLLWLAALVRTAAYVVALREPQPSGANLPFLDVLSAALWAAAWLVHLATLRQIAPDEIRWPQEPRASEAERLRHAFQWTYAGCYRLLRTVYGVRRARALDDRMDVLAATADWDVTLDHDRARVGAGTLALTLERQGARFAEVLRYTVAEIEQIAGTQFARRAVQAAYDALPWPERETAGRLCFPDTPWARALSNTFGDARAARVRLLRQVDAFLACDDDALAELADNAVEQHAPGGTLLLRAGQPAPGLWIVVSGEVRGMRGDQIAAELHRGEIFGANQLLRNQPVGLTYRAGIACSLLFIPNEQLAPLAASGLLHTSVGQAVAANLRLLEQVPLFASLPRGTLRGLALVAEERHFPARTVVVRQGVASGVFYIIRAGRAVVVLREPGPPGATPAQRVAQLGSGEFFGELELLRGTLPVANVIATTALTVLALPHQAMRELLLGDGSMARELEQVGSGRLRELRATKIGSD
jgi:putative peptide zinc metalloprotease protein